jgi:hypothetical protein
MELTALIAKIIGPVLLLRSLSILIDRQHFVEMIAGLPREAATISFSMFPIALFVAFLTLAIVHTDWSSIAAILIRLMAWGGMAKTAALILFPALVVPKVQLLEQAGILNVVLVVCFVVGAYFTWFGYFAEKRRAA